MQGSATNYLNRATALFVAALLLAGGAVCKRDENGNTRPGARVTLYCSVDEVFARTVVREFESKTAIGVDAVFDSEAGKTTGLVNRIVAESQAGEPRADVFWSSEIFNTILLARQGLFEPYDSPEAADIPRRFRDSSHRWTATAVRARVVAFDLARTDPTQVPVQWEAFAEARFAGGVALANPLFGTTRGHVAAMFATWGPQRGRAWLTGLRDGGALVMDGNSAAVRAVMNGRAAMALTDSDDVWMARRSGSNLDMIHPEMGGGGTLLIPCTVALMKGRGRRPEARTLVDFLVSSDVERMLAKSDSRNIPVRADLRAELDVAWPAEATVDFEAVADVMPEAVRAVREILLR